MSGKHPSDGAAMPNDPKTGSLSPIPVEPLVPHGASWAPEKLRIDASSAHEVPAEGLGPEFPLTPAARSHTVTDEELPGDSVIDHGPDRESHSELPATRKDGRLSRGSSTS